MDEPVVGQEVLHLGCEVDGFIERSEFGDPVDDVDGFDRALLLHDRLRIGRGLGAAEGA